MQFNTVQEDTLHADIQTHSIQMDTTAHTETCIARDGQTHRQADAPGQGQSEATEADGEAQTDRLFYTKMRQRYGQKNRCTRTGTTRQVTLSCYTNTIRNIHTEMQTEGNLQITHTEPYTSINMQTYVQKHKNKHILTHMQKGHMRQIQKVLQTYNHTQQHREADIDKERCKQHIGP
jgi:hypothetical protein